MAAEPTTTPPAAGSNHRGGRGSAEVGAVFAAAELLTFVSTSRARSRSPPASLIGDPDDRVDPAGRLRRGARPQVKELAIIRTSTRNGCFF